MVVLAHGQVTSGHLIAVGAMLVCQQVAISLHNDWCDRALDATAKPWRAIPSGYASPRAVRAAAWLLAVASLAVALPLGWLEVALDAIALAAGFAYNASLKRTALSWLPFAVAFPLIPLFGPAAMDDPGRVWQLAPPFYAVGAPLAVAIHLADTLPDLLRDRDHGVRGLAHRLGERRARVACAGLFAAAALILAETYRQIVG
jgi:4-hydroxybenzoate polyprenyltransferase